MGGILNSHLIMVELRNVTKCFGQFVALKDASFEVKTGEFMTFLGPSGCGKTTCLRMIGGFEMPSGGEIFIDGKDITFTPPYRRDVNQVFQNYALFPHLSIFENIAFGLRMKRLPSGEIKNRVHRVVEMTALETLINRKPSQISGGQRQRVALARAIVCEPKVLLLDEPLSALDAKLRAQMRLELKVLQKKLGITFIFVTHDQEEALTMSDRVVVMNEGHVEQIATVHDIYHKPATRFVASFIGDNNLFQAEILGPCESGVRCQLIGGQNLSLHTPPPCPSGKILLSIRPEKIRLHREQISGVNCFQARISLAIFKGSVTELTLSLVGGLKLTALLANDGHGDNNLHEGDSVYLSIQPEDISIIFE